MRALTVKPHEPHSLRVETRPDPEPGDGELLVETIAIGICGTDREIEAGLYGAAPGGQSRLVLGHESLGRVLHAPRHSGFTAGDHVVGIVRRPDPVPCPACAAGRFDMCFNDRYTERGIKERDGYAATRFCIETDYAVKIDRTLGIAGVLTEPASVVAKAWREAERLRRIAPRKPHRLLVTGAGSIGLLAALMGAQRRCEVHVLDRTAGGIKQALVEALDAHYHVGALPDLEFDTVMECTGAPGVIADLLQRRNHNGVICLAGVSSNASLAFDIGASNRMMVLTNATVFGTVNANRGHYASAVEALEKADRGWLMRMISRRVDIESYQDAFAKRPGDIKVVLTFGGRG
jgi:threonine dehydrogenase-like Zn-dependent dehydrogenase